MDKMVGLPSDHALVEDDAMRTIIERYARDEAAFFRDFAAAMTKLSELGATWRDI